MADIRHFLDLDKLDATTLRGILDKGRCDGMIACRVGADNHDDFGVRGILDLVGYGTRADSLEKRRYRRGMAKSRAVINIISSKSGTHQLLQKICFFVTTLGTTERSQCIRSVITTDIVKT